VESWGREVLIEVVGGDGIARFECVDAAVCGEVDEHTAACGPPKLVYERSSTVDAPTEHT